MSNEEELLAMCYGNSMQLAIDNNIKTIAFPCISTGAYRFPFDKACMIALTAINSFLGKNTSIEKVFLGVFGESDLKNYEKVFRKYYS